MSRYLQHRQFSGSSISMWFYLQLAIYATYTNRAGVTTLACTNIAACSEDRGGEKGHSWEDNSEPHCKVIVNVRVDKLRCRKKWGDWQTFEQQRLFLYTYDLHPYIAVSSYSGGFCRSALLPERYEILTLFYQGALGTNVAICSLR